MPKKRHHPDVFMPWFIMDYQKDTMHLTLEEDGLYRRMLDMHWLTKGQGLPDDDLRMANCVRVDLTTWLRLKPSMRPFFKVANGVWINTRNYAEYLERVAAMEKARAAAGSRWGTCSADASTDARTMPEGCPTNAQRIPNGCQSESKSESEPKTKSKALTKCVVNALADGVEEELLRRTRDILGDEIMNEKGGLLRTLIRDHVAAYRDTLVDMENRIKEAHLPGQQIKKTRIACFIDTFKRFKKGYRNVR